MESNKRIIKIGLIVNPFAGIGGKVGLKGSDGYDTVQKAFSLGANVISPSRAIEALKNLVVNKELFVLYTYPAEMGEDEARASGFEPIVVGAIKSGHTTAQDTRNAACIMNEIGVDLILFVGGDGTARDIYAAIGMNTPVVGIPAGVKIHSSVFAINPQRAANLVAAFLEDKAQPRDMEVMDIDEDLFREGQVSASLYGYLKVPFERNLVQGAKAASRDSGGGLLRLADYVVERIKKEDMYFILGPGTTIKAIGDILGIDKTLLGVDLIYRGKQIAKDVNEEQLLKQIVNKKAKIIVTVIGGQGYIFGRGNQQISPSVIKIVEKQNIMVVAAKSKLLALDGSLLVDTGDPECDKYLSGFIRVITGVNEETVWKVES